jgi:hypothetical protein
MSLINDALRRAKDAQQQTPPQSSPNLPFKPVEPAQQCAPRGQGMLLPVALVVIALLLLLSAWQWFQQRNTAGPTEVNARTPRVAPALPAPQPAIPPTAASAPQPDPAAQPNASSSPAFGPAAALAADDTAAATNAPLADAQPSEVTNTAALAPPPPPQPAPLRLQGIVFDPRRPSAMISGKTLFVGDKLGDLRVVAIDKASVTLTGASQTNVLSLPE